MTWDAVKFGSAEHQARFEQYRATLEDQANEMIRNEESQREVNKVLQDSLNKRLETIVPVKNAVSDFTREAIDGFDSMFNRVNEGFKTVADGIREQQKRIQEFKEFNKNIPNREIDGTRIKPFGFYGIPEPPKPMEMGVKVQSAADQTLVNDRELTVKLLQSMDKSLQDIRNKPQQVLGTATISNG